MLSRLNASILSTLSLTTTDRLDTAIADALATQTAGGCTVRLLVDNRLQVANVPNNSQAVKNCQTLSATGTSVRINTELKTQNTYYQILGGTTIVDGYDLTDEGTLITPSCSTNLADCFPLSVNVVATLPGDPSPVTVVADVPMVPTDNQWNGDAYPTGYQVNATIICQNLGDIYLPNYWALTVTIYDESRPGKKGTGLNRWSAEISPLSCPATGTYQLPPVAGENPNSPIAATINIAGQVNSPKLRRILAPGPLRPYLRARRTDPPVTSVRMDNYGRRRNSRGLRRPL